MTLEKETFYLPCIWSGEALEPLNPNDKDLGHYFIDVVRQTADFDVVDLRPAGFFGQRVPD